MKFLSRQEELILLTIWRLRDDAYGVTIRKTVTDSTQKYWSIGAIYDVLDRLVEKGFVNPIQGEPTHERGGRSKRYYRITKEGFAALEEVKKMHNEMWADLPGPVFKQ